MAGMNLTSRLEAKDKKIASLKERLVAATTKLREAKASGKTRRAAPRVIGGEAGSRAKPRRRPASSKGRTRARTRSAQPAAA
jgi:hypothetical protein